MNASVGRHREDGEADLNALAAWVDGRLDARERADLAAHLASCAQCRAIVAELTRGTAPASSPWKPALPIAATIVAAAIGGGAYLLLHERADVPATPAVTAEPVHPPGAAPAAPSGTTQEPPARAATPPSAAPRQRGRTRAAGRTSVAGKSFHLVAGEWIDDEYRESDFLPVVEVSSQQQLDAIPAVHPYITLGRRFTVVIAGSVYKVALP